MNIIKRLSYNHLKVKELTTFKQKYLISKSKPTHHQNPSQSQQKKEENEKEKEKENEDEDYRDATENFMEGLNKISDLKDGKDIDSYLKVFNNKLYKQNLELTNKIQQIFNEGSDENNIKLFIVINEINKVNINNVCKLFRIFLNEIVKVSFKNSTHIKKESKGGFNYIFLFIILLNTSLLSFLIYLVYQDKSLNVFSIASNLIQSIENFETSGLLRDSHPLYKVLYDIPKPSTHIKNLILIGETSSGKSSSLIRYLKKEHENEGFVIYADLSKNFDYQKLTEASSETDLLNLCIVNSLLNKKNPKDAKLISKLTKLNSAQVNEVVSQMDELLSEKKKRILVIDNISQDKYNLIIKHLNKLNSNYKFTTILCSNSSLELQKEISTENLINYQVSYLNYNRENVLGLIDNDKKRFLCYSEEVKNKIISNISNDSLFELYSLMKESSFNFSNYLNSKEELLKNELKILKSNNLLFFSELKKLVSNQSLVDSINFDALCLFEKKNWIGFSKEGVYIKNLMLKNLVNQVK